MGGFPKPSAADRAWFTSLLAGRPEAVVKPMFGNLAAFVNGHMAIGLLGREVAVRLDEKERAELLREPGAHPFVPMPGKAMREYVVLPPSFRSDLPRARLWVARACAWVAAKPPKATKGSKPGGVDSPRRAAGSGRAKGRTPSRGRGRGA